MRKYTLIASLMTGMALCGQTADRTSALDSISSNFEAEASAMRAEFEAYEQQALADYFRYVQEIKDIWGGDTIVDNTRTEWVEYGKELRSRSVVDFETGDITVAIVTDGRQNDNTINSLLTEAIERLLGSRGSTDPYSGTGEPLTDRPILDGIVDLSGYDLDTTTAAENSTQTAASRPTPPSPTVKGRNLTVPERRDTANVNQSEGKTGKSELAIKRESEKRKADSRYNTLTDKQNKSTLARKIVEQSTKKISIVTGNDGQTREIVQVQMALVSDNISKNAALYKDIVAEFSKKFQVEQPLIFAVMEVESYFNPQAKSWVPAYGLMQLVPTSGGADAYRYVYNKSWIPTMSYLFNPRNNIELGTAYLRILMNTFSKVTDEHCRRLCVIAGYNTGAGNVSRAFIGTTNVSNAITSINCYGYNDLYSHLVTRLPHQETRNYVKKVTEKRNKYIKQ